MLPSPILSHLIRVNSDVVGSRLNNKDTPIWKFQGVRGCHPRNRAQEQVPYPVYDNIAYLFVRLTNIDEHLL